MNQRTLAFDAASGFMRQSSRRPRRCRSPSGSGRAWKVSAIFCWSASTCRHRRHAVARSAASGDLDESGPGCPRRGPISRATSVWLPCAHAVGRIKLLDDGADHGRIFRHEVLRGRGRTDGCRPPRVPSASIRAPVAAGQRPGTDPRSPRRRPLRARTRHGIGRRHVDRLDVGERQRRGLERLQQQVMDVVALVQRDLASLQLGDGLIGESCGTRMASPVGAGGS